MSQNPPMRLPHEVPEEAYETLDPSTDPSVAGQAQSIIAAANEVEEVEAPNVPNPNMGALHVSLPIGIVNVMTGAEINEVEVRELNGEDEEYFQRAKHFQDQKTRIVERGVVSMGEEEPTKALRMSLTVADREAILLGICRATYGDLTPLPTLKCPRCGHEHDVEIDLTDDVKIVEGDGPKETITLRDGSQVTFHWPTVEDERFLWDYGVKNQAATDSQMNTVQLSRVIEEINGQPWFGEQSARKMGLAHRSEILKYLVENIPGPKYDGIPHSCPSCDFETTLEVTFQDLFR